MTNNAPARHPFLDDLTLDAELMSTILRKPVSGRENVKRVVEAVGSLYKSQAPTFFESAGTRKLLQYDAVLSNGLTIHGTVVIEHNPEGSVPRVSVTFSPFGAAIACRSAWRAARQGPWRGSVPLKTPRRLRPLVGGSAFPPLD
jgi:hypothetical protein